MTGPSPAPRRAEIARRTAETDIRVAIDLDGTGRAEVATGIGFLDHMLTALARHSMVDMQVAAKGDLHIDFHHTAEDVGIVLGQALRQALGSARGIRRFGACVLPMAEAKVEVAVDVSNRAYLVYRVDLANDRVGDFDVSLVEDFLYALAQNAGLDLHVEQRYGRSPHHVVEAVFKGLARALRAALEVDPRVADVPSVKGTL